MTLDLKCQKCGYALRVEFDAEWMQPDFVASAAICDRCAEDYDERERKYRAMMQRRSVSPAQELRNAKKGRTPYKDD